MLLATTADGAGLDRCCRRRWRRGGGRWRATTRARSSVIWRSASRSAVTAWLTSALLRAEPEVFGPVASDPTVSRLIDLLAADAEKSLAAINTARAAARAAAWRLAGKHAPDVGVDARRPLVVDLDATLITAHSARKGLLPISSGALASIRCGHSSTTALPVPANPSRACSGPATPAANTAADHISVIRAALAQLPAIGTAGRRPPGADPHRRCRRHP